MFMAYPYGETATIETQFRLHILGTVRNHLNTIAIAYIYGRPENILNTSVYRLGLYPGHCQHKCKQTIVKRNPKGWWTHSTPRRSEFRDGCVFFFFMFSLKGCHKLYTNQKMNLLDGTMGSPISTCQCDATNTPDAFKHVPSFFWRAPGPENIEKYTHPPKPKTSPETTASFLADPKPFKHQLFNIVNLVLVGGYGQHKSRTIATGSDRSPRLECAPLQLERPWPICAKLVSPG